MQADVYAKAMLELAKSGKSDDDIVKGLLKSLKARGSLALLPKVANAYTRLLNKDSSARPVLTVARESDVKEALSLSGTDAGIDIKIDDSIIGGYRLEEGGKLLDNSFKAKLLQAYRSATKA